MMLRQLQRFGGVGLLASATHWLIAMALIHLSCPPMVANPIAFVIAFNVSYFGHRHITFEAGDLDHRQTLPRFILVALTGFCANQALFWAALHYTSVPPDISLGVIILIVAAMTFVLSRMFAFARA